MPLIQSCCCWRSLRRGCYASGFYTMAYFAITIITMGHFIDMEQRFLNGGADQPQSESFLEHGKITPITVSLNITLLACSTLGLVACVLLLIGIYKDKKFMLLPWIVSMALETVVEIINVGYLFYLQTATDPRAKLTRHYTEDIPYVSLYEISVALKHLKNNRAPGDDTVTAELLKAGGLPVRKALHKLFNSVILEGKTPKAWHRGVVKLFFKKNNRAQLKNYRPTTLLSHVYKLFSRDITNRLARRFDDFQPPEQAIP